MGKSKEVLFQEVDLLLEAMEFEKVVSIIQDWQKISLIQFVATYPENFILLKHKRFDQLWAKKRAQLSNKYNFVKQPNINDIDFVIGYTFYLAAKSAKEKDNLKDYTKYLSLAIKHGSIHAAQAQVHDMIFMKTKDVESKLKNISSLLDSQRAFAEKHGTPGYLFLANGCLQLLRMGSKLKDSLIYDDACYHLWYHLKLAELFEPYSKNSIHNAYFGKGLSLSNSFSLKSISEMKSYASSLIKDDIIKVRAENKAKIIFKKLRANRDSIWQKARSQQGKGHYIPKTADFKDHKM